EELDERHLLVGQLPVRPDTKRPHQLLPDQQWIDRRPHAAPGDDLLDDDIVFVARLVEWRLEPASAVGSPALGEIVESNRRSTLGGATDEVAPEGDTVSVD